MYPDPSGNGTNVISIITQWRHFLHMTSLVSVLLSIINMPLTSYFCYAVFYSALCPEIPLLRRKSLEWPSPNGNLKISPTREVQTVKHQKLRHKKLLQNPDQTVFAGKLWLLFFLLSFLALVQ